MFELQSIDPQLFRQQTRRSSLLLVAIFAVLGMLCATLSSQWLGSPGGDNFRWNLLGVLSGLGLTVLLVRYRLWSQPFMAAARYGWQLKRNLMRITNQMHLLKAALADDQPAALQLLGFYQQALEQMYLLDGNTSELAQLREEMASHARRLEQHGLAVEQRRLDPAWLEQIRAARR